jgi:methionyl aminopeptidase
MVVHGIPGPYVVADGDILSIDVGVTLDGFVADSALTLPVGKVGADALRLLDVTRRSLEAGIGACRVGNRLGDVSHAVQEVVEAAGFAVVRSLVGHGVGREMHEEPQIPNYGPAGKGPRLAEGMVFAIEPMVNVGDHEVYVGADRWSIFSSDGSLSAHFEHTVALTTSGPRVLTRRTTEVMGGAAKALPGQ